MFRAALLAFAASVIATASTSAQTSVANFYKNKTIQIVIASAL